MAFTYHRAIAVGIIAVWFAYTFGGSDIPRLVKVIGVFRSSDFSAFQAQAENLVVIEDTVHCEDLHHHRESDLLFTACEDTQATRHAWFPPLAIFDDPILGQSAQGSIHVIDPTVSNRVGRTPSKHLRLRFASPPRHKPQDLLTDFKSHADTRVV
jgi:hypothetical protein